MLNNTQTQIDSFSNYPSVLSARHIGEILGLGYVKALRLIKYGGISYIKIGNTFRVPKKLFIEWLYADECREIDLDN